MAITAAKLADALRRLKVTDTVGAWLIAELGVNEVLQWYFDDPNADWLDTSIEGWRQIFSLSGQDIRDGWDLFGAPASAMTQEYAANLLSALSEYVDLNIRDQEVAQVMEPASGGEEYVFEDGLLITPSGEALGEEDVVEFFMEPMVITPDPSRGGSEMAAAGTSLAQKADKQMVGFEDDKRGNIVHRVLNSGPRFGQTVVPLSFIGASTAAIVLAAQNKKLRDKLKKKRKSKKKSKSKSKSKY